MSSIYIGVEIEKVSSAHDYLHFADSDGKKFMRIAIVPHAAERLAAAQVPTLTQAEAAFLYERNYHYFAMSVQDGTISPEDEAFFRALDHKLAVMAKFPAASDAEIQTAA
jgi:hypothetical protein